MLRFAEPDLDHVVYVEQLTSALYLYNPYETGRYHQIMEQLCLRAEPAAGTVKILGGLLAVT